MPITKVGNRNKSAIATLIFSSIVTIIPLGIIALISLKDAGVWGNAYSIYVYAMIGVQIYFAAVVGMVAWRNARLYTIIELITVLLVVGLVVLSYICNDFKGGVLLHIGAATLFTYFIYKLADTYNQNNVQLRYVASILTTLVGLITCLWFISVHFHVVAHIVIASIFNGLFGIIAIVEFIQFFTKHSISKIGGLEFEYEEETEEEIAARKAEKRAKAQSRRKVPVHEEDDDEMLGQDGYEEEVVDKKRAKLEQKAAELGGHVIYVAPGQAFIIDPSCLQTIVEGLDDYYKRKSEAIDYVYEDLKSTLEADYQYMDNTYDADNYFRKRKELKNSYYRWHNANSKAKKNSAKFIRQLAGKVFTERDCGYYYEIQLHSNSIKKKKIVYLDRFQASLYGIVSTVRMSTGMLDKSSKTVKFDRDYLKLRFKQIR